MSSRRHIPALRALVLATVAGSALGSARAAEHITLRNGFELDCTRREAVADRVRLYTGTSVLELPLSAILRTEPLPDPPPAAAAPPPSAPATVRALVESAGRTHHIDADLLSSIVHAESGGRAQAVSHAGAQGLMQLMPGTALAMGVTDAFVPEQNISGGTAYLDQLLTRYHDSIVLSVAAYNAGPGAVDRWHGVPPYPETRAYVARVVREFNRRKLAAR